MGVGYEYVDQALNGGLVLNTLLLLCFLKLGATVISYSSGNAGGIFAPSLYIGAMAGGAVGVIVHQVAPFPTGDSGAYALVGMGTLFAGIIRAPMTSVVMIFEITQNYQILVPLMVANMLSFAISHRYQPTSVYHALLQQDDVHLPPPGARTAAEWTACDIMRVPAPCISASQTADALHQRRDTNDPHPWCVGSRDGFVGVLRPERVADAIRAGLGVHPVEALVDTTFPHVHLDDPMDVVVERLASSGGFLPVVSRANTRQLEGVITIDDLTRALRRKGAPT
jgi:CIC family chloride channel protein